VWFRYTATGHGKHPGRHLAHFKGLWQAEALAGFNGLYARQPDPLVEVACWAYVADAIMLRRAGTALPGMTTPRFSAT